MSTPHEYWFPAKRHGWGWGPPTKWQGWVVIGLYVIAVFAAIAALIPKQQHGRFFVCLIALTAVLLAVCWWKGERPRWRRGDQ